MSGRPKVKMYEYDTNGKFIQTYNTMMEVINKYYEGKKRPLLREGKEFGILPNGNLICYKRIGRDTIEKLLRIENSKYVTTKHKKIKSVALYNMIGEKIATFRSAHMAHILTGVDRQTIENSIKSTPTRTKSVELVFKYDEDLVSLQDKN